MLHRTLCCVALVVLAACNGGVVSPPPFATGTAASQHLYVVDGGGRVSQFTLPLSATSTSNFVLPTRPFMVGASVDTNGNLAVTSIGATVQVFNAPISGSTTPAATFTLASMPTEGKLAFTAAGDLILTTNAASVYLITHPFSDASTKSVLVTNPALTALGVILDGAGNLYVSNPGSNVFNSFAGPGSNIFVYAPPYGGSPIITPLVPATAYRAEAVSATQLFVVSNQPPTRVDVFALPITAASVPAFSITNGIAEAQGLALDAAGNLYVGNHGDATVAVYAPPFSPASAPTLKVPMVVAPVPGTPGVPGFDVRGLAIGK